MNMLIEFNFINRGKFIKPHSNFILEQHKDRFPSLSPSLQSINYLIRTHCFFRDKTSYPISLPTKTLTKCLKNHPRNVSRVTLYFILMIKSQSSFLRFLIAAAIPASNTPNPAAAVLDVSLPVLAKRLTCALGVAGVTFLKM